jgi:hypothetical protein
MYTRPDGLTKDGEENVTTTARLMNRQQPQHEADPFSVGFSAGPRAYQTMRYRVRME